MRDFDLGDFQRRGKVVRTATTETEQRPPKLKDCLFQIEGTIEESPSSTPPLKTCGDLECIYASSIKEIIEEFSVAPTLRGIYTDVPSYIG